MNHEPEDKYIEQVMCSLAQDRVKPAPGFKRRLSANLKQELQSSNWRFNLFLRWAYVAAMVILLAWSFTLQSPERALLTVHKGAAQVSSPRAAILWWLRDDSAVSAAQSQSIVVGGKIELSRDSQAVLSFFDGSILELFPGSQLEVVKAQPQFAWQPVNVQVKLLGGGISVNVSQMPDSKQRFEIDTSVATISARDAVFQVYIVAQDQTYVATESGSVNVTLNDPARSNPSAGVPAGYEIDAIPGQPLIVRPVSSGMPGPVISSSMQPGNGFTGGLPVPSSDLQTSEVLTDLVTVDDPQDPDAIFITGSELAVSEVSTTVSPITKSMPLPAWFVSPVIPDIANTASATVTVPDATGVSSGTGVMTGTPPNSVSQGWADLYVSVIGEPELAPIGGKLKYVIVVTNLGPAVASDIVLTSTLPAAVTVVDATTGYQRTSSHLVWELGTLGPDTSKILTVTVQVRSWASKRFTHTVKVVSATQDDDLTNNSVAVSTNTSQDIDFAVSTMASPPVIVSGDVVTYTIDYVNYGPAQAPLVDIVAALPPEVHFGGFVTATPRVDLIGLIPPLWLEEPFTDSHQMTVFNTVLPTWRRPTLAAGDSGTIVFTATVSPASEGIVTYTAIITNLVADTNLSNNRAVATALVRQTADLAVSVRAEPVAAIAGGTLTYTLAYTNYGPSHAVNVEINSELPLNVTFGQVVSAEPELDEPVLMERSLQWLLPELLAGEHGEIVFTVTVNAKAVTSLLHEVTIGSPTLDRRNDNNAVSLRSKVRIPKLSLTSFTSPGTLVPGMPFTYTLEITNKGRVPFAGEDLQLRNWLPSGVHYVPGSASYQPSVVSDTYLIWNNFDPLLAGESLSITFGLSVTHPISGEELTNIAVLTGSVPGRSLVVRDELPLPIGLPAVSVLQFLQQEYNVKDEGLDRIKLELRLLNPGPSDIEVLPLSNVYDPAYLEFVSVEPIPDMLANGQLTWENLAVAGALKAGESVNLTLVFSVADPLPVSSPVYNMTRITGGQDIYGNPLFPVEERIVINWPQWIYLPSLISQD